MKQRLLALLLCSLAAGTIRAANCPSGIFLEATAYPAGTNPSASLVGLFNADAFPDLAVVDANNYRIAIVPGNGDGTFGAPIFSDTGYGAYSLASGDFNGDGKLDLVVGAYGTILVLLGNGDGTFAPPVPYSVGNGNVNSIAVGKLDAGDSLDLVVTTDYGTSIYVLLGSGSGTFGTPTPFDSGAPNHGLGLADFNEDGALDVVASHPSGNTVSVFFGNGNGGFGSPASVVAGSSPDQVVTGDFTGDGHADIVVHAYPYVSLIVGDGAGGFLAALQYFAGPDPGPIVAADLDGDGWLDIAVQSAGGGFYGTGGDVSILHNDAGFFHLTEVYLGGNIGSGLAAGDLNGDGAPDLVSANGSAGTVSILIANGGGGFEAARVVPVTGGATVLASGFFNDDQYLDLVAAQGSTLSILLGDGTGGFTPGATYQTTGSINAVLAQDLTSDSKTDLLVSMYGYNLQLFRGVGDGTFIPDPNQIQTSPYPGNMVAGFFRINSPVDVAVATGCCGFGGIDILFGNGDGTFQPPQPIDLGLTPVGLVSGFFNNQGPLDLAVTAPDQGKVLVLLGNGDGTFQPAVPYAVPVGASALAAGVLNTSGGNTSLFTVGPGSENVAILFGNGDGTFSTGPILALGQPAGFVGLADFDVDGKTDIFTTNGNGNSVSVFHGHGDGVFDPPDTFATGSNATFGVVGDYDSNGQPDLAVAASSDDSVTLLYNSRLGAMVLPGSLDACVNSSAHFDGRASGFGPITYQWFRNLTPLSDGGNISGAQTAHLVISPVQDSDYGDYTLSVTDLCTTAETIAGILVVHDPPGTPVISVDQVPAPGVEGTASATPGGLSYAWEASGATITSGQGTPNISFLPVLPGTASLKVTEYSAVDCGTPSTEVGVPVDYFDVPPSNIFHDDVVTIGMNGVTAGCGNGDYCPTALVTRAQMAVFLLKSLYGALYVPPQVGQIFADVPPGSFAYDWINNIATLGVTAGCGGADYCPDASVTRAQMAIFLLKTLLGAGYTPPAAVGIFGDVPVGSFAADWIEDLYNRGIAGGCSASPLLYCPGNPVNRGQMAALLVHTFF